MLILTGELQLYKLSPNGTQTIFSDDLRFESGVNL